MPTSSLQIIYLLWQVKLVDTLTLIPVFDNTCAQYGTIVAVASVGNSFDIGAKVLLEPIRGLGTSYRFVRAAQTRTEQISRVATLATFLSTSGASILTRDPAINVAVGGNVSANIGSIIGSRGGATSKILKYQ